MYRQPGSGADFPRIDGASGSPLATPPPTVLSRGCEVDVMTAGFQEVQIFEENVNTVMHRALRAADGLRVILKSSRSFYPSATERRRLQYEHELLSSISADGVVRVLGLQHGERGPVLVMEDFGGVPLRTLLPPSGLPLGRFFGL